MDYFHVVSFVGQRSFSPTDKKFASAGNDGVVKVWDYWGRKAELELKGKEWHCSEIDWHPWKALVGSACRDNFVRLWSPSSGKIVQRLYVCCCGCCGCFTVH